MKPETIKNSVLRARIGTQYSENSSHKPPGASYTAQEPEKQPDILRSLLYMLSKQLNPLIGFKSQCFETK